MDTHLTGAKYLGTDILCNGIYENVIIEDEPASAGEEVDYIFL